MQELRDAEDKVSEWLGAGTRQVWIVSPRLHTVTIYSSATEILVLTEKDMLEGGEIVPGFAISVSEIFAE